jgi:hypothetical protein
MNRVVPSTEPRKPMNMTGICVTNARTDKAPRPYGGDTKVLWVWRGTCGPWTRIGTRDGRITVMISMICVSNTPRGEIKEIRIKLYEGQRLLKRDSFLSFLPSYSTHVLNSTLCRT